ncbi:YALI0B17468p [Yarrowia lipolytica CLIB122]|uniref:YALI0B17468p n=2 Tax=Yarrowia lipolytica TaxID=4952 RepID=Q6CE94_YARLI|nr:YALI0B17468p [Yarrowia lipolytica CLIB122]AOW01841.1 hypothetical protein YALI1_B22667g [Yarrowia lipolytica]KAB8280789.1 hypothetical protein BKA91DRAFT_40150 [Yarrowia lipolytica]KAE8170029.1 hypothetical protein BKA90DRAFT_40794 [Yarrowia lipolytica]KAJ8052632.1 hypothetical protein LXG23DRAFT_24751 [Yarrowia lipolytica]RMJ01373.1 hypothetical protein BD777DRAFT_133206 [Yarrowia lipolytica]|eukprot:XP_501018.1 YALI0B17468p [Yarrowia lipolytica CLIB122]
MITSFLKYSALVSISLIAAAELQVLLDAYLNRTFVETGAKVDKKLAVQDGDMTSEEVYTKMGVNVESDHEDEEGDGYESRDHMDSSPWQRPSISGNEAYQRGAKKLHDQFLDELKTRQNSETCSEERTNALFSALTRLVDKYRTRPMIHHAASNVDHPASGVKCVACNQTVLLQRDRHYVCVHCPSGQNVICIFCEGREMHPESHMLYKMDKSIGSMRSLLYYAETHPAWTTKIEDDFSAPDPEEFVDRDLLAECAPMSQERLEFMFEQFMGWCDIRSNEPRKLNMSLDRYRELLKLDDPYLLSLLEQHFTQPVSFSAYVKFVLSVLSAPSKALIDICYDMITQKDESYVTMASVKAAVWQYYLWAQKMANEAITIEELRQKQQEMRNGYTDKTKLYERLGALSNTQGPKTFSSLANGKQITDFPRKHENLLINVPVVSDRPDLSSNAMLIAEQSINEMIVKAFEEAGFNEFSLLTKRDFVKLAGYPGPNFQSWLFNWLEAYII